MDSTRQQKIGQLIRKELGDIFLTDGKEIYGCMITVTRTNVSKDLSIARSYLSIYNSPNPQAVLAAAKANTKNIRFRLGQKVKNQLRVIPQLEFFIDDSLDYIENIENLLKQ
ncbi:30S ribosome-binding factor RbfA [Bacteroidales bacterium OttesenSCG-928-B11]|nr:30S ribosome-binding factor RbfA [Bacteroidales bacterium OttesenSCG-928-E04]MDL2308223.1 30S ribosome-binding factor RbfA [Bacteroidales bacterium OttesenSCG-928-C03]MDL2311523.1 30S ribosome-binding factor RbfA [Bacteroidales bacterium OttesenSCG-928-B11]MDL2325662.1 30S ribosome-binding factor RbfA [Bacteroidales bacterium OttesenSCG-928-A14]